MDTESQEIRNAFDFMALSSGIDQHDVSGRDLHKFEFELTNGLSSKGFRLLTV